MLDRRTRAWWAGHAPAVLRAATVLLAIASAVYLGYKSWQLVFGTQELDAIDLLLRHDEVRDWFAGTPIYGRRESAVYPPATYVLLWPALGWLADERAVRILWAALTVATLVWLVRLTVRESAPDTRDERRFLALVPLALYPTGGTIGNGQVTLQLVLLLVLLPPLLRRARAAPSLRTDLLLASTLLVCLLKPNLTAPFFWLVLMVPGRIRPAALVVTGYVGLTLLAAAFQPQNPVDLFMHSLRRGSRGIAIGASRAGFGSVTDVLPTVQLPTAEVPTFAVEASLVVLALFGVWVWLHRRADPWLLAGVAAIVSRVWIYHAWYDDLLILIAMIALFRLAKGVGAGTRRADPAAALAFALLVAGMIAPGGHYLLPEPARSIYATLLVGLWLCVLVLLAVRTRQSLRAASVVGG